MIRVYCENITNRHRFIFGFIFEDILATGFYLTENVEEVISSPDPALNYSNAEIPGLIRFSPLGILSEKGVKEQKEFKDWRLPDHITTLQPDHLTTLPPDPFALAFYLVTRYEEYLPFKADQHGRFPVEQSLAYKMDFLRIPLVNIIADSIKELLEEKYPGYRFPKRTFRFIPSFDIDIAFAHLGKGFGRAAAAWAKLALQADVEQIRERLKVIAGRSADPYDNFDVHLDLAKSFGYKPLYFTLVGDFSRYDRNTSYKSKRFKTLLGKLANVSDLGLHPSYRSHLNPGRFEMEKRRLGNLVQGPVVKNRFHFLRLKFPESYRLLISQGITDDYSLGYSTVNGFRASTATPFYFYDLERDEQTGLKLHPFIFMDSAMIDHMKLSPRDSVSEIKSLLGSVQKYGGEAIGIWHNYSLSEKGQYKGYMDVLKEILTEYQSTEA